MMQLTIKNSSNLYKEIDRKILGIKELASPYMTQQYANSLYRIIKRSFMKDLSIFAASNSAAMGHVYEWGNSGNNTKRLFDLTKVSSSNGKLVIGYKFIESKMSVPIDPILQSSGSTGKHVSHKSIFRNKAAMIESGKVNTIVAKSNIAFVENGEIVFRSKGSTIHSGGRSKATGQFNKFFNQWSRTKMLAVVENSSIFKNIEKTAAKTLNITGSGPNEVKNAVSAMLKGYDTING